MAIADFWNIRPYFHGLHVKGLHVTDGRRLKFEYGALGDDDVDYLTILRRMRDLGYDSLSLLGHPLSTAQWFPCGDHSDQLLQPSGDNSQGGDGGVRTLLQLKLEVPTTAG